MSPCCGGNRAVVEAILAAKGQLQDSVPAEGYTRLRFVGERQGPVTYYANGRGYPGANMEGYRFAMVRNEDVDRLLATGVWVKVRQEGKELPATVVPTPEPPAPQVRPTIIPVGEPNVPTTQVAAQTETETAKGMGETTAKPKSKRRSKVGA